MLSFNSSYTTNSYDNTFDKEVEEFKVSTKNFKCKRLYRPFEYSKECINVNYKSLVDENAIGMTEIAVSTKTVESIDLANTAIDLLEDSKLKDYLTKEISDLEHSIEQEKLVKKTDTILTKAKKDKNESLITEVEKLIENLDDEQLVKEYKKEINKLKATIKEEKRVKAEAEAKKAKAAAEAQRKIDEAKKQATAAQKQNKPTSQNKKPNGKTIEKVTGAVSAFSPYCQGCGGYVAYGKDVRNGNIYHYDPVYGSVRIVAGDSAYPFGTIVRFNNLKGGTIYAIVLDRGGSIGKGRHRLWDLLFTTQQEAYQFGVAYNVEAEILRLGF